MKVTFDADKRALVLALRHLDFKDASRIFDGFCLTGPDTKHSQTETRMITLGSLDGEVVIIVWTPRPGSRRIVTMWKANEKERRRYHDDPDRPG